jgi:hypothetical protein
MWVNVDDDEVTSYFARKKWGWTEVVREEG